MRGLVLSDLAVLPDLPSVPPTCPTICLLFSFPSWRLAATALLPCSDKASF